MHTSRGPIRELHASVDRRASDSATDEDLRVHQVRTFLRVRRAHGGYPGHPRADYLQVSILRLGQLLPDLVI
jgi:hypothetical protein